MKKLRLTLGYCLLLAIGSCTPLMAQDSDGFENLRPLYSSKADVEKLLGVPNKKNGSVYETNGFVVTMWFSTGLCSSSTGSNWNVPKDTVVGFIISPKSRLNISTLFARMEGLTFQRSPSESQLDLFNYNSIDGSVRIQTKLVDGVEDVSFIVYSPKAEDAKLKCTKAIQPRSQRSKPVGYSVKDCSKKNNGVGPAILR